MSATVKVSNISPLVSAETLRELFAHLGTIESIQDLGASQFSANTKEALVTFEDASAAEIAMHLTGTELGDKMLLVTSHAAVVSPAVSLPLALAPHPIQPIQPIIHSTSLIGNALGQGVPGTNIKNPYVTPQLYTVDPVKADEIGRTIYVGNISLLISEADLTQMFSACGPVTFIKMAGDPAHGCRFAFVEFAVVEAANEAISLHGTTLAERPLKVTYSKNAINKGPKALDDTTMRRVREAELRILNKDRNLGGNATVSWCAGDIPPARRPRSRSRSRSYDRRRDRSPPRRRRRSRSRSIDRYRRRSRSRSRSPGRSRGSSYRDDRDRDRDRSLDRHRRRRAGSPDSYRGGGDRERDLYRRSRGDSYRGGGGRSRSRERGGERERERDRERDGAVGRGGGRVEGGVVEEVREVDVRREEAGLGGSSGHVSSAQGLY